MGNSPSADLGGGSAHSSRDVRTTNREMEVKRSSASRAPTHNEYTELPASQKPHNRPTNLADDIASFVAVHPFIMAVIFLYLQPQ